MSAIYIFKLTIDWSIEEEMDRKEDPQQNRECILGWFSFHLIM